MAIFEFSDMRFPEPKEVEASTFRKAMASVAALMLSQRLEVFQEQGSPTKWQALSPRYAAWKLREFGGKASKILSLSNALRQSFTPETGPGNAFKEVVTNENSAKIETHVPYAAIQNFGGVVNIPENKNGFGRGITIPAHAVTIPPRPFDEFREADKDEIAHLVESVING